MSQEPAQCWAVIDSVMSKEITVSDPYYYQKGISARDVGKVMELLEVSPYIMHANTMEELAEQIGVPVETFLPTLNRYNA